MNLAGLGSVRVVAGSIGAMVILLVGVRMADDESEGLGWLGLATLGVAFVLALGLIGQTGFAFGGALAVDGFAAFFQLTILIAAAFTILMSLDYASDNHLAGAEYYSLLLFSTLGMMLMAAAGDLIVIFLGLETMSIAVYVLAGLPRPDPRSHSAPVNYFFLW